MSIEIQANDNGKIVIKKARTVRMLGYSPGRLATVTTISRGKIYQALNEGGLIGRKLGNRTIIMHGDAVRWLKSLPLYKVDKLKS